MFFFLPIFFGCQTKLKPQGDQQVPRVCPNCHNGSIIAAKKTTWFELFFIPVVPISSKHVWFCHICQWRTPIVAGQELPTANYVSHAGYPPGAYDWQQPQHPGYQPGYPTNQVQAKVN
ncbi:hypothetical protein AMATHDRAFT_177741 [Amanita thiersii Skay4041]|uniref:Uncharacterized protein n=1 Tax=Amanita thiersii Skay4041 TaxID=703135 RepID=A0A2A9NL58_9AGAR|nr:hypothetical protein AMATHDRAFT_177741 [Amanita thiersii Skay4041]